jgi:hypothetical protein
MRHRRQKSAVLVLLFVGGSLRIGGQPLIEGDGEGEEFFFAVEGVDHFYVEFGVAEGGVAEVLDVVEEIAAEGGVGVDDGGGEAEVVVVLGDLLVDRGAVNGDGDEWDVDVLGAVNGEDAAVDLVFGGGGDLVVVGGDELDAGVFEGDGAVGVVGKDDADGKEAVGEVGETEEGALARGVAGVGGYGDMLVGVGIGGGVLGCGPGGWGGLGGGVGGEGEAEEGDEEAEGWGGPFVAVRLR